MTRFVVGRPVRSRVNDITGVVHEVSGDQVVVATTEMFMGEPLLSTFAAHDLVPIDPQEDA